MSQNGVTDTTDSLIPYEEWEPSPAQARIADALARCRSQSEAAELCSVPLRTVQRWWTEPNFRTYVREIQRGLLAGFQEEFSMLIAQSIIIEGQALRGEIEIDDRARLAHDVLAKTAYRIAEAGDLTAGADIPKLPGN